MFAIVTLLPAIVTGAAMMYFSSQIANLFKQTGSVNLIRGLDNPWTFKTLGFTIAVLYPAYLLMLEGVAGAF